MAVRAAQLGLRTLVLTVDPAKRLATALGLDLEGSSEHQVNGLASGPVSGGSLTAAVIDSKKIFDQFIFDHAKGSEVISRIMKNRLYQQLSTTLSGSQEFTALERLLQAAESGRFDLVVLDTPPTKHAMDFLTAPDRIKSLFQDSVTRWFMAPSEGVGFISGLIGRGTRVALKSLEILTGSQFIEELIDFFGAIRSVQLVLRERSERAHRLLTGKLTQFFVVTSFDSAKLIEAKYLQRELDRLDYHLRGVIINRAFPIGIPAEISGASSHQTSEIYGQVLNFFKQFRNYYSSRYNLYQEFADGLGPGVATIRLPEYENDVHGIADLERLAQALGDGGLA